MTLATDQNSEARGLSPTALRFMSIRDAVMDHWEREVRAHIPGASALLGPVLTNTIPAFFDNIAEALSPVHPRRDGASGTNAASAHGEERARMTPFGPDHVAQEYQILREAIRAVATPRLELAREEWAIIDQSINSAMLEALRAFALIHEEMRRKLAAALSHDMRTPLSVIANGAQLIGLAPTLEVARRTAAKIEANATRLGEMMAELLDALTLQSEAKLPLRLTRFDARALVEEVRDQYCQTGAGNCPFEASGEPVEGYWCRSSLRRALENLVNNAVKYGDGKGVKIKSRGSRGRLMLSVHNTGNPIPKEKHNLIFDYLRREGDGSSAPGWGIGLQFVKAVAESHGGSVAVDSSPELGTTFLIDVPADCRPFVADAEP